MARPDPRESIVDAALELFCAEGYHAVGTQEICAKAGVLKGTLYHFFPAKQAIAVAALEKYGAKVGRLFAEAAGGRAGAARRLIRVFEVVRQSAAASQARAGVVSGCLHGNLAMELAATEPTVRDVITRISDDWAKCLETPIRELMDAGVIPPGDPLAAAHLVLTFLSGAMLAAKVANDPEVILIQGRSVLRLLGGKDLTPLP